MFFESGADAVDIFAFQLDDDLDIAHFAVCRNLLDVDVLIGEDIRQVFKNAFFVFMDIDDNTDTRCIIAQHIDEGGEDILFGDDADQTVARLDYGQNTDAIFAHRYGRFFQKGFLVDGHNAFFHDVSHCRFVQQVVDLMHIQAGHAGRGVAFDDALRDQAYDSLALNDRQTVDLVLFHQIQSFDDFC